MSSYVHLEHIEHRYSGDPVLRDVSLEIPPGQIFGLLGPSGSGKTTLVKIMLGLIVPTSGKVTISNTRIPSLKQMQKIGYMAQSDALYHELTGWENLDFFASIYGLPKKERKQRIEVTAAVVDLSDHLHKTVDRFSGGMRRRMSLAVALLHQPELLILDEPTIGIDPVLRASIWQDFKELREKGTTIILTTHAMDEAEKCDRLALLRGGHMIAMGSPDELKRDSGMDTLEQVFLHYGTTSSNSHLASVSSSVSVSDSAVGSEVTR